MATLQKRLQVVAPQPAETPAAPAEITAETAQQQQPEAAEVLLTPKGILHNKHGVDELERQNNALLATIAGYDVPLNMEMMTGNAQAYAACRMLVLKGICTEAEMQGEVALAMRRTLYAVLQALEEQRLARTKVQPVKQGLVVARH